MDLATPSYTSLCWSSSLCRKSDVCLKFICWLCRSSWPMIRSALSCLCLSAIAFGYNLPGVTVSSFHDGDTVRVILYLSLSTSLPGCIESQSSDLNQDPAAVRLLRLAFLQKKKYSWKSRQLRRENCRRQGDHLPLHCQSLFYHPNLCTSLLLHSLLCLLHFTSPPSVGDDSCA
jgi:hypothetical protein